MRNPNQSFGSGCPVLRRTKYTIATSGSCMKFAEVCVTTYMFTYGGGILARPQGESSFSYALF